MWRMLVVEVWEEFVCWNLGLENGSSKNMKGLRRKGRKEERIGIGLIESFACEKWMWKKVK